MTNEEIRRQIEQEVTRTVGYSEAANKESFMTGARVAISKAEDIIDIYRKEIAGLKHQINALERANNEARDDLKTLAKIIDRYSDNL